MSPENNLNKYYLSMVVKDVWNFVLIMILSGYNIKDHISFNFKKG